MVLLAEDMIFDWNAEDKGGADVKLLFTERYPLTTHAIRFADHAIGVYFLGAREGSLIDYPFRSSRLLYIGMSKSRQNSIGSRLRTHLSGRSGNIAIFNYSRVRPLVFSYFGIEVLRALGTANVPQIESFFLDSFLSNHGAYPICNNQCGVEFAASVLNASGTEVDWARWE